MASATWHRSREGPNALLIVTQRGSFIARMLIGLPVLGAGLYMLFSCVAGPVEWMLGRSAELANILVGTLVTGLIAACTLPLGWYLVFMRRRTVIDPAKREIWEVIDYRFGKRVLRRDAALFREVRVRQEAAGDARRATRAAMVNSVRLMPRRTGEVSSLEVAFFDTEMTEEPAALAKLVGELLGLPVKVRLGTTATETGPLQEL